MKIGTYNQLRLVCILGLSASFGLTGCKVGSWKMPKMSWNREPSATTLAGSETPKLPESPANKYTPSTIASVGAGTSPGTTSGNKAPTYGYAGQTSSTTTPVATGLAASANGYQTGPYTVGQKPGSQPNSGGAAGNVAAGPNPYGGSYAGITPAKPTDATLQNGVKGALANYPAPNASMGYGSAPQASGSAYAVGAAALPQFPAPPAANSYGMTTPNTYSSPVQNNPYPSLPAIPSSGGLAAGNVGQAQIANVPNYPAVPVPTQPTAGQTSVGNYTAGGYNTGSQPINRYSGVYQPGTTSRSTTYNFGSVAPATATAPSSTGPALPPNTASNPQPNVIR